MNEPGCTVTCPAPPPLRWQRHAAAATPAAGQRSQTRAGPGCGGTPAEAGDAALIERSWQEPEAFAAIFARHAPGVHRFAARRLGAGLAGAVGGEGLLGAFRRRAGYDLAYPDARPWLYGIATNVIHRHRHAERRAYQVLARTGTDPVADSATDDALARVAAGAQRRQLAAALAGLPAADRDTLLLWAWGGLSYSEVARALQIPGGTVRSRLNRARRKLRRALGTTSEGGQEEKSSHA